MSSDIMAAQMSTKNISFSRSQSGWLFREDKTVRKLLCEKEIFVMTYGQIFFLHSVLIFHISIVHL